MKYFTITYLNAQRKTISRQISATDKKDATLQASQLGQVIRVKRNFSIVSSRMSLSDRMVFFQRLSAMLASRVGSSEALLIMEESFGGSIRDASRMLRTRMAEQGEQLHEAMGAIGPRYFPEAIVAIIETGSQGGDLAFAIREAARFERELAQVRKGAAKGIYSAIGGFLVALGTILASTMYVAPQILESDFLTMGGEDSTDIQWVVMLADWSTYLALGAAAIVVIMFLFGVVMRPLMPSIIDRIILRIPFYRDMVLAKTNYMVFFGLAVLLKAGLRVEEALTLTINTAPRGELKNDLERARTAIREGSARPWPYVMNMLHATDKAALATAQDRTQTAFTIEELASQYQSLYQARMETFAPAMQGLAALFLAIAGVVLFGVSIVPLMQSSASLLGGL